MPVFPDRRREPQRQDHRLGPAGRVPPGAHHPAPFRPDGSARP